MDSNSSLIIIDAFQLYVKFDRDLQKIIRIFEIEFDLDTQARMSNSRPSLAVTYAHREKWSMSVYR